jgi:hypothetical protein
MLEKVAIIITLPSFVFGLGEVHNIEFIIIIGILKEKRGTVSSICTGQAIVLVPVIKNFLSVYKQGIGFIIKYKPLGSINALTGEAIITPV